MSNLTDASNFPTATPDKKHITVDDLKETAKLFNLEPAVVDSVMMVESGGHGYDANGRPKILFEGHKFYQYISTKPDLLAKVLKEQKNNICYKTWADRGNAYNLDQYTRLNEAISYDKDSAYLSASWGLAQIMGGNFKASGYKNVEDFVKDMYFSEEKQLIAMFNFIKASNKMYNALKTKDWATFALNYNGSGYKANKYDIKLADEYTKALPKFK